MNQKEWLRLIPIAPSALNNARSSQRDNIATITAFIKKPLSILVDTFICTTTSSSVSMGTANEERKIGQKAERNQGRVSSSFTRVS